MLDIHSTCTQAEFGELVGIGQPAVSGLLERGVITAGQSVALWLLDYSGHLREQAAGRGADGELAYQRSELARVSRERAEIKLALERKEYAPVALIEQVLATIGRSIAGVLEPLHLNLHKLCPALTPEDLKIIQLAVARACDVAASASLAALDADDMPADTPEQPDELTEDPAEELAIVDEV